MRLRATLGLCALALAVGLAGVGSAAQARSFAGACGSPPCYTAFTVNGGAPPPGVSLALTSGSGQIQVSLTHNGSLDLAGSVSTSDAVHMVLDVGAFDPVVFGTTGVVSSLSESLGGGDNLLTIDLKPSASSWNANGCSVVSCGSDVNPVTATNDFGSIVLGFISDMNSATQSVRDAMRGTWFSTNAQAMTLPTFSAATGKVSFTVAAPHFETDGTTVNSGFFEFFAPDALVEMMGVADPTTVSTGSFTVTSSNAVSTAFAVSHQSSPAAGVLIQAGTNPPDLPPFNYSSPTFTVAKAEVATRTLTVTKAGDGSGSVSSSPDGVSCGSTCAHGFDDGTVVTLTASAAAGSAFTGWSGAGCSGTGTCQVTLHADASVTATFAALPAITGFSPHSGRPGTAVTVTGTNLGGATTVELHGESVAFALGSATQLTFAVPADGASGPISVTTAAGTASSSADFTVVVPAPAIRRLSPAAAAVGSTITIAGIHLTGATQVLFDGTAATTFAVVSDTALTAVVPPGATTGKVIVRTPGGRATSAQAFTVLGAAPTISGLTPSSARRGVTVLIHGSGFMGATAVTFHGVSAIFRVLDDGRIRAVVPRGATSGPVVVTTPGGSATSAVFTIR